MNIAVYYFKIINSQFLSEIKYFSKLLNQIICILYPRILPNLYPVSLDSTQPASCIRGFSPTCVLYPRTLAQPVSQNSTCILQSRILPNLYPVSQESTCILYPSIQPVSCILGFNLCPVSQDSTCILYPVSQDSTCILYPRIQPVSCILYPRKPTSLYPVVNSELFGA